MSGREPNCQAHCPACESCFTSTGAFAAHRAGDHASKRYCAYPDDIAALAERPGTCHLSGPPHSTLVYTLAANLGRDPGELIRGDDE